MTNITFLININYELENKLVVLHKMLIGIFDLSTFPNSYDYILVNGCPQVTQNFALKYNEQSQEIWQLTF